MNKELDIAVEAARQAGELLKSRFSLPHQLKYKEPANLVTEMDLLVEKLIGKILLEAFPDHSILGEEQAGSSLSAAGKPRWIVDPLDGTTNYAHGYPLFAVSIALEKENEVVVGVVYCPMLEELFSAQKGAGAFLNGNPIRVSGTASLGESLLASGFPYDAWTNDRDNGDVWHRFLKQVISLRSDGVAALDLCNVAAGRTDGYWELDLEAWDMAAGALIVEEAGGRTSSVDGSPYNPFNKNVVASNGLLHDKMLKIIG